MGYQVGSGYFFADNIKTSLAKQEIIQAHKPQTWTTNFSAYKFTFLPYMDCHAKVNGVLGYFPANMTWSIDYMDARIKTFEIQEAGIQFIYSFAY